VLGLRARLGFRVIARDRVRFRDRAKVRVRG